LADPHDPIGVAKPQGWSWWIQGRASRREYWTYVGLLIGIGLILQNAAPIVSIIGATALLLVQIRRVHDFGRSGWWAFAALVAPLICLPLMLVATVETTNTVGELMTLGLVTVVGAFPGEAGENRFGPPPPFTVRRVLTGR
jgi:uncharacterized membrane protein YhaH (DUF805 family)